MQLKYRPHLPNIAFRGIERAVEVFYRLDPTAWMLDSHDSSGRNNCCI